MSRFHALRVADVRRETDDSVSVAFDVPGELRDAFAFVPGQYLTLRTTLDGEEVRRCYSICSAVDDGELRVGIKRVAGGLFSNWVNDSVAVGDTIETMPPEGRFTATLTPDESHRYVMFAGGSGITPILSIAKSVLEAEPKSIVTLIYGNRTVDSVMFREPLEDLKNRWLERFRLVHVLSEEATDIPLHSGLLDDAKCTALLDAMVADEHVDAFYICGPEPMREAAQRALAARGIATDRIRLEVFSSPRGKLTGSTATVGTTEESGERATVTVILDGKRRDVDVGFEGMTILNRALEAGFDLPFACKGGMCATCRARVVEGRVEMDTNYSLEPDEVEAGFVLTCQSHPRTPTVTLDYDAR